MFLEATSTKNLRRKVAVVGTVLIISPMVVLGLAAWTVAQRMQQPISHMASAALPANLTQLTQNLVELCRSYHRQSVDQLQSGFAILNSTGRVWLAGGTTSSWNVKNEVTGQSKAIQLPLMAIGEAKLVPINSFDQVAPIVDDILRVAGTPATIFQRLNEHGDMVRICSSLKSESGQRAIGTYLPADAVAGEQARALQDVLAGKTSVGTESYRQTNYLTAYQPLTNTLGTVVGMLQTVLPEDTITAKIAHFETTRANANGPKLFILRATGAMRGTAVAMSDSSLRGTNLWNEKDASGELYIQALCSRALKLNTGELADFKYQSVTQAGGMPKLTTARFAYLPELDWVVGFAQPEANSLAGISPLSALATWALWLLMGVGVAGTGLAVRIWLKFSDDLAQNLNGLLSPLRSDARQLAAVAAEFSQDAEQALALKTNEIRVALQHIDASSQSAAAMIAALDQIAFAADLLAVNQALQPSNSPGATVDQLRSMAEECRQAASQTQAQIEQSRLDLQMSGGIEELPQPQSLLLLAQSIEQSVAVITADLGVE